MSASPRDCILYLANLPKQLTSRRNLHAYFVKCGDIKSVSVNKDNRTGKIEFSSHAEAKAAKIQGRMYEGKPLKLLLFESKLESTETVLDPRAREEKDMIEVDSLWEVDDKECFGIATKPVIEETKKTAKEMISQHLKLSNVKKRLGSISKTSAMNKSKDSESKLPTVKKSHPKVNQLKKTQANKRKLVGKQGMISDDNKTKISKVREQSHQIGPGIDRDDLTRKLKLLEERDLMIREKTVQDSNIETVVTIKGTCPDMCPEKERIMRQSQHLLADYECFPGTKIMDENKVVKEYLRSSADKKIPLPHDLRPGPVLSMTMNYLITNIINLIDDPNENKALWYSFCWNRLRSIRKDINWQQLCDLETVTIVEQCARFHIACYDHMMGFEVSGYADKINTNNLIDCLQNLKHRYEDLSKRGIRCPNEPEFLSYLLLLKLPVEGDVFCEYQQYPPEIQLSPKVQFAIEVYMAVINNMYSKYFSLVKQASYLEACLMQRHFDEVRTKALNVMLKAYSRPTKGVSLTASFIMTCLKFDSQMNVLKFCEKVKEKLVKKIVFDEDKIEDEYVSTSSFLIKEKRLPIANAVVGEKNCLPIYVPHQVHTSFDEDGNLRESLQPDLDESYDSYDSAVDESDTSISGVKPQSLTQIKPFKFSLSPKAINENVFTKNVFSRLGPLNTDKNDLINRGLSENDSAKLNVQFSSDDNFEGNDSFYEGNRTEPCKMEEGSDEDMVYEENYNENAEGLAPTNNQKLFTEFTFEERPPFEIQKSFPALPPIIPVVIHKSTNNFFQSNDVQPVNLFSTAYNPKEIMGGNLKPFPTKVSFDSEKQFSSKNDTSNNSPLERIKTFQPVSVLNESQENKTSHFILPQHEIKSKVKVELNESHATIDVSVQESNEYVEEAIRREKEILDKLLMKKAEEERIKIEEANKAELQRQKKKIEEQQQMIERLRKDLCQRMKVKNAKKYARIWKTRVEKLKKKRADFPMLHQLSVESHLKLWGRMRNIPSVSVSQRAKERQKLNIILYQLLANGVADACRYIGSDLAELLAKSAARTMNMGSIRPIYWKLAMSLPWIDKSTSQFSVFNQMMRRCCKEAFYKNADAQLGSVESTVTSLKIPVHTIVHFSDDLQSCSDLHGLDALIFVVVDGFESEKTCLDRLRSLVTSQARSDKLAVSVMTINEIKSERVLKMELKELHEQGLIAFWAVNAWKTPDCLNESLAFFAEHVSVDQDVCARPLDSLIREAVEDIFYEIDRSQVYCPELTTTLENPNTVINIYNTFLAKFEDLMLSPRLEKYFSFSEEFRSQIHIPPNECGGPELMCGKQFNKQYKSRISSKIRSLKLTEFLGWPAHTNEIDFDSLADLLETYCTTKLEDLDVFRQGIQKLALESADPLSYLNSYSWLHIVKMWVESRLDCVFSSKDKNRKMFVIYKKNDLQRMIKKQWWITPAVVSRASKKM